MAMDPFTVLTDIEQKCRIHARPLPRAKEISEIWKGIGFSVNNMSFVVPLAEIKEILVMPSVTTLPASSPWFLGVTNFRGHVLPLTDLQGFLFDKPLKLTENARVLVVQFEKSSIGFLVQQVVGVQQFFIKDQQPVSIEKEMNEKLKNSLQGNFQEGSTTWSIISLHSLSQTSQFYHVLKEMES